MQGHYQGEDLCIQIYIVLEEASLAQFSSAWLEDDMIEQQNAADACTALTTLYHLQLTLCRCMYCINDPLPFAFADACTALTTLYHLHLTLGEDAYCFNYPLPF